MSKILITGGSGFIGCFLAKQLAEDSCNQILIADNLSRGRMDDEMQQLLALDNVSFIEVDLTEKSSFDRLDNDIEVIYHLAAVIGVKNVLEKPDKVLYTNAISMLYLLEFCKTCNNLKKIVFSSTSEISAGTLKHFGLPVPTPEDVPLTLLDIKDSRTTYALSKMYGESICYNYGRLYNIPFTIVRFFNVYGPRMGFQHVIPEMFVKMESSDQIQVASPDHTRAFCYVEDAVNYLIALANSQASTGEVYNIGNSTEEISIINLVQKIAKVLDKQITIKSLPDTPGSPNRRCPDTSKVVALTGFKPQVSLEEGISKTFQWYKSRLVEVYE